MATSNQMQTEQDEMDAGFNDEAAPAAMMTDDEAFGLGEEVAEEAPAEMPAIEEEVAAEEAPAADPEMDAKEEQRMKSWEGRLKAKEAELAAREAAGTTPNVDADQTIDLLDGDSIDGDDDDDDEPAADGDDPRAVLAADFGDDFVELMERFIGRVAGNQGGSGVSEVQQTVQDLIGELAAERQQKHFSKIAEAHEDFNDVVASPEFGSWITGLAPEQVDTYERVIDGGSAKEIISMLTAFKGSKEIAATSAEVEPEADIDPFEADEALASAEGVRSGGARMPKDDKGAQDFGSAFDEAASGRYNEF